MDVIDARIMKCKDITIIVDKKMRERKIKYQKFIIRLEDNNPFQADEFVKIIRKNDFNKLGDLINSVKNELEQLKDQVKNLHRMLDVQEKYIEKVDESENKGKGILKSLIN
jgi:septal ring factor EnvC (AmiA/AmiB activator)